MIGFVKWLILQYQCYKLEKTFDNKETKEKHFMSLFSQCSFSSQLFSYLLMSVFLHISLILVLSNDFYDTFP